MKLKVSDWDVFHIYIATDKKLSEKSSSLGANKSRFLKITTHFTDIDFTRENFNKFMALLVEHGYTPSYRNSLITLAKHLDQFYGINQIQDYSYFRTNKGVPKDVLSASEIQSLAEVVIPYAKNADFINLRQKALILLLGTTGMRIGELLGLQWEDIRSTPNYSYVVLDDTKNGHSRSIPVGKTVYDLLMSLPKRSKNIFCSARGGKLESQQINLDLKKRAHTVGIQKKVFCHLFRHSFITELLQDGVELSDVSVLVGHIDPRNTMRYKNSLLDHYYQSLISNHPLLREDMSFVMLASRIKEAITKLTDEKNFNIKIEEDENIISVEIEKK